MKQISVLDCTLRDGGYVNNFSFGSKVITDIIKELSDASIDIVECGFLKSGSNDESKTLFASVNAICHYLQPKNPKTMYVAMVQYGAIDLNEITDYDATSIDGIRLTFHEHEIEPAFQFGEGLIQKGYKVFMQPVGTTSYEDASLVNLIKKVNDLKPYAFYLVDTLGMMYKRDLLKMLNIIDHNLDSNIALGFHSHNNLQMSFANAQEFTQLDTTRHLIVDSSILGMGRGAGNLNTELFTQYLNVNQGLKYDSFRIMNIIDQYITPLKSKYKWGYDAAYYLAAITGCHPNYATFLLNKQTLQVRDIGTILNSLDNTKRNLYDAEYIQHEYRTYMENYIDDTETCQFLKNLINDSDVLLLAPGKSLKTNSTKLQEIASQKNIFTVSINFIPHNIPVDLVFISNIKRFNKIKNYLNHLNATVVVTSNIKSDNDELQVVNYSSYLNEDTCILDNAGMMCINLFKKIGVKNFELAGFDGFSKDSSENFFEESLCLNVEEERLRKMNIAIANKIKQLRQQINISFLNDSSYE